MYGLSLFFANLVFTQHSPGHLFLVLYLSQILMGKPTFYSLRGPLLTWFHSFLSHLNRLVRINFSLLDVVLVISGTTYDSILWSLLLIAYISNIRDIIMGKLLLGDDDLRIFLPFSSHELRQTVLYQNMELNEVAMWCSKWEPKAANCGCFWYGDSFFSI